MVYVALRLLPPCDRPCGVFQTLDMQLSVCWSCNQVHLIVATSEGLLYEYAIEDLDSPHGPKCSLGGEWTLLGAAGLTSS